jgi:GNAT superfamily N-acetyltransferase
MAIRPAVPSDIAVLQDIRAAVRENMLSHPGRVTRQDYEDHLGRLGQTWVHVEDSKILGFSAATIASASIWALFVDPMHEGRGIGRGLLDSAVAWLRAQGAERITLTTSPGTRAERVYRVAGWVADPGETRGDVAFTLSLLPASSTRAK